MEFVLFLMSNILYCISIICKSIVEYLSFDTYRAICQTEKRVYSSYIHNSWIRKTAKKVLLFIAVHYQGGGGGVKAVPLRNKEL